MWAAGRGGPARRVEKRKRESTKFLGLTENERGKVGILKMFKNPVVHHYYFQKVVQIGAIHKIIPFNGAT